MLLMASLVGERVKDLRAQRGLSQEALAARVGVSRKTVSNWETGETTVSTAHLGAIAVALGVDEADLVGGRASTSVGSIGARGTSTGVRGPAAATDPFNATPPEDREAGGRRLPVYRWGSMGDPRDHESSPHPDRLEWPPAGRETLIGPSGFAVDVRGHSMTGRGLQDGDTVWVNPDRPYRLGGLVLALVDSIDGDSGMVVKTYARTEVGDCLLSENDDGKSPIACRAFSIIGPVVWIHRGFPPT